MAAAWRMRRRDWGSANILYSHI